MRHVVVLPLLPVTTTFWALLAAATFCRTRGSIRRATEPGKARSPSGPQDLGGGPRRPARGQRERQACLSCGGQVRPSFAGPVRGSAVHDAHLASASTRMGRPLRLAISSPGGRDAPARMRRCAGIPDSVHDAVHVPFVEGVVQGTRPQGEAAADVGARQERSPADLEVFHDRLVQQIQAQVVAQTFRRVPEAHRGQRPGRQQLQVRARPR